MDTNQYRTKVKHQKAHKKAKLKLFQLCNQQQVNHIERVLFIYNVNRHKMFNTLPFENASY